MNKKILIAIIVIAIFVLAITGYFILKLKESKPQGKVYIIPILHIEPNTPKNQEEFLLYSKALDRFLDIAEKHNIKISVHVEKEWAEACLEYNRSICENIEKRGHELSTHTHNYADRIGMNETDTFESVKQKMFDYIKARKESVDQLSKYNDVIAYGKFSADEKGRMAFLASHQAVIDLGFKVELTAHDDLNYLEYYMHPQSLSYDDPRKEDPSKEIMFVTGKLMKARAWGPAELGEMHPKRLNELKDTFLEIYKNAKPNEINVFMEGSLGSHIEGLADTKTVTLREKAFENFDDYLSFFDEYIEDGTAESVTFHELYEIYRGGLEK